MEAFIFLLIFAACVFLVGVYMFTGHKLGIMTGRPAFKNLSKNEWKNIGKWTMIVAVVMAALCVVGLILTAGI